MIAMALVLILGTTFAVQQVARADDTGRILGAVAAGLLVYELLDDDGPKYKQPKHYRHQRGVKYERPNRFERAWGPPYYDFRGYSTPFPHRYRGYYALPYRGRPLKHKQRGITVGIDSGPRGTSMHLRYRDNRW